MYCRYVHPCQEALQRADNGGLSFTYLPCNKVTPSCKWRLPPSCGSYSVAGVNTVVAGAPYTATYLYRHIPALSAGSSPAPHYVIPAESFVLSKFPRNSSAHSAVPESYRSRDKSGSGRITYLPEEKNRRIAWRERSSRSPVSAGGASRRRWEGFLPGSLLCTWQSPHPRCVHCALPPASSHVTLNIASWGPAHRCCARLRAGRRLPRNLLSKAIGTRTVEVLAPPAGSQAEA